MKILPLVCGIYFVALGGVYADSEKTCILNLSGNNTRSIEKMTVRESKDGYTVEFMDAAGEGSINHFNTRWNALQSVYVDKARKEFMRIRFDQESRKIISSGFVNKTYNWEERVYDGNGSLFYVFSQILPEPDKQLDFHLLQSKEKRIVQMYLKFVRRETIQSGSKKVDALLYETGLVNRFLSFFWPYKYRYWYSAHTHEFLRYEGPVGHQKVEVIEVASD